MEPKKDKLYEEWKKRREEEVAMHVSIGEIVKGRHLTEYEKKVIKRRVVGTQLDVYNVMVMAPYIGNEEDILKLLETTKKFRDIGDRMKENPVDISSPLGVKLFPNINTLTIRDPMKYHMFHDEMKTAMRKKQIKKDEITEEEKEDIKWQKYDLRNAGDEQSSALIRKLELSTKKELSGYSMYDLGEVIAPKFKGLMNIKVELEPGRYEMDHKYNLSWDFLRKNDERTQRENEIEREADRLKRQGGERLEIPYQWKRVPDSAFVNSQYREIIISPNVIEIRTFAFLRNETLERIVIPANVMIIGFHAFSECKNLKEVTFAPRERKDKLKIGAGAFHECAVTEMIIPDQCQIIGTYAFETCKRMKKIHLPNELEQLDSWILSDCINLEIIEMPERFKDHEIIDLRYMFGDHPPRGFKKIIYY